jgi:hypothetical protein
VSEIERRMRSKWGSVNDLEFYDSDNEGFETENGDVAPIPSPKKDEEPLVGSRFKVVKPKASVKARWNRDSPQTPTSIFGFTSGSSSLPADETEGESDRNSLETKRTIGEKSRKVRIDDSKKDPSLSKPNLDSRPVSVERNSASRTATIGLRTSSLTPATKDVQINKMKSGQLKGPGERQVPTATRAPVSLFGLSQVARAAMDTSDEGEDDGGEFCECSEEHGSTSTFINELKKISNNIGSSKEEMSTYFNNMDKKDLRLLLLQI